MTKKEQEQLIDMLSEQITKATKELDITKRHLGCLKNIKDNLHKETDNVENNVSIEEEFYKWCPIVDEGEYWTEYDIANVLSPSLNKIQTIITNGARIYTYRECNLGWGTMAKQGNWKYMRIKL